MSDHRQFLNQLENFRHEAHAAAQYLYSDMAVQHAASKSKKLLNRLNMTPTFWLTHRAGMQVAAYVTIGRVFDTKSRYNISALLDAFEDGLSEFSREALAERKREGRAKDPEWLAEYLAKSHYPTMGRTPLLGWPMLWHLRRGGLRTSTFGYMSSLEDFLAIRGRLIQKISTLAASDDYVLIGHSMGGVLIRAAVNMLPPATRAPHRVSC